MSAPKGNLYAHLVIALGGAAAVGALVASEVRESKRLSRVERENPELAEEVFKEIAELLDAWEAEDCETEDDFTQDLAAFLDENTEYEIEVYPGTSLGKPDILVEDMLALELKVSPSKAERDRLVGQCAGYSRQWITWAVLLDTPASMIGDLERLLKDKGLEHILVWSFEAEG